MLATNKQRQRERFAEAGVPQPRWEILGDDDEARLSGRRRRQGARPAGPEGAVARAGRRAAEALAAARARRARAALVEELVDGPEVTVIGFSADGEFMPLAVTDRITAEPPAFGVALAHVWPPRQAAGRGRGARAVAALGIEEGPSYTQLRIGPDGPEVIEVAARLGGGHDAELVEAATGVDLNGLALAAALGEPTQVPAGTKRGRRRVTRFLVAPPGVLESVEVPDGHGASSRVRIYREPGYVFTPLRRGPDRAGALLAVGDPRGGASRGLTRRRNAYASSPPMPQPSSKTSSTFLSFQPPAVGEEEVAAAADAIRSGWLTSGPRAAELERACASSSRRSTCSRSRPAPPRCTSRCSRSASAPATR